LQSPAEDHRENPKLWDADERPAAARLAEASGSVKRA
jgi:hypothetical protein